MEDKHQHSPGRRVCSGQPKQISQVNPNTKTLHTNQQWQWLDEGSVTPWLCLGESSSAGPAWDGDCSRCAGRWQWRPAWCPGCPLKWWDGSRGSRTEGLPAPANKQEAFYWWLFRVWGIIYSSLYLSKYHASKPIQGRPDKTPHTYTNKHPLHSLSAVYICWGKNSLADHYVTSQGLYSEMLCSHHNYFPRPQRSLAGFSRGFL